MKSIASLSPSHPLPTVFIQSISYTVYSEHTATSSTSLQSSFLSEAVQFTFEETIFLYAVINLEH